MADSAVLVKKRATPKRSRAGSAGKNKRGRSESKTATKTTMAANPIDEPSTQKHTPDDVKALREMVGISQQDFARLLGFSVRAIAGWEGRKQKISAGARQRYMEVKRLQNALAGVMNESFIAEWLKTPNPAFDGLKPLEVIERGETDRIWRMIFYLEAGEAS